ncbi:hypothetical protein ACNFU2_18845 [Chryseobacterium sp. PTM-20240506]|uniref:hypothetical protein n=1 Tax=unclassified Chryseobacterium TaxID=2593645 RepID=UPI0015536713|nr:MULTISPECIES: hypothetical protein [unclassified Chryseobacterium]MDC8106938.1 hypothetical protein [Chryseobacterium sp. B21-037]MDQ1805780.1 hypothetical protein [Chryseobacterium sp. CKR4-1]WBV56140.1 hypothetical protein PFY10_18230 [Chryseobacterium daecheongense]
MNTIQRLPDVKSYIKSISIRNYRLGFNLKFDRKNCIKSFFIFMAKEYEKDQEKFIRKTVYGIEHQRIDDRNRIKAHTRKQTLKRL